MRESRVPLRSTRGKHCCAPTGAWFDPIRQIPGVIIQGRYDACTPMITAWELHKAWPEADFQIIPDAGHAFDEPGIADALVRTTDLFAG